MANLYELNTKKENKKISENELILDHKQVMLINYDPAVHANNYNNKVKEKLTKKEIIEKLASNIVLCKEKVKNEFVIVEELPESESMIRYLKLLSKKISYSIGTLFEGITEEELQQARKEAYSETKFRSESFEDILEQEKIYKDYFRYLINSDQMYMIKKADFDRINNICSKIIADKEFYNNIFLPKNMNLVEEGIKSDNLYININNRKANFQLIFKPFCVQVFHEEEICFNIIKYTEGYISQFKEEFFKNDYDLEVAHAYKAISSSKHFKKSQISCYITVFDKYGKQEWFNLTQKTVNEAIKKYESILKNVYKTIELSYWEKPFYMNDDFKKL